MPGMNSPSRCRSLLPLSLLLLATACGGHALAGTWTQRTEANAPGAAIEFERGGDKVMVHLPPEPGQTGHGHESGTYTFDETSGAVTVRAAILGKGKPATWTGTMSGSSLELNADGTKLSFRKGGEIAGH